MKPVFTTLIFLLLIFDCSYAQIGQPIAVSILKESPKVDTVFDNIFLKEKSSSFANQNLLKDSCVMLEMFPLNKANEFDIEIVWNSKSAMNYRVNRYQYYKTKYGCFIYKGHYIFVWTKNDFGELFTNTNTFQTFSFIKYSNDTHATLDELYAGTLHYQFKNGTISEGGLPPTVEEIKQ